ncbi:hypothetical protein BC834DRAFT_368119 [Gloeopeniophorella convolvens]|nr:hypothetical protein BC834DRAFT_368119 [Gloeopeniophorella convolvens]
MSQPRNNLDELQRQLLPPQQQPYNAPTPSQKTSKFKPAKAGNGSTPSNSTSSGSIRAIPHKRLSSDFPLPSPTSPKRPRLVTADSEKENVFTTRHKGKEKEWTSPCLSQPHSPYTPGPSSQRLEPPLSVLPQPLWTPSHPVTVQSRGYTYGDHSDLRHETIDRLWKLYEINDRGLTQARKARDKGRMRRDPEQDAYMLEIVILP